VSGQVIGKGDDLVDLDAGGRGVLESRDDRPGDTATTLPLTLKSSSFFSSSLESMRKFSSSAETGVCSGSSKKATGGSWNAAFLFHKGEDFLLGQPAPAS
jgi:hypothetical protein